MEDALARRMLALTVCVTWGCVIDKVDHGDSTGLVLIEAGEPVVIHLFEASGSSTVDVPMRLVNSHGIGIPGDPVAVSVHGAGDAAPTEVEFDVFGYASTTVEVPTNGLVHIQIDSDGIEDVIGTSARVYGVTTVRPAISIAPTWVFDITPGEDQWLVPGTDGVAVGGDDEIWWVPRDIGQVPHQVADLPYGINGMISGHVDSDDVLDVLVWAGSQVVLLGGRPDGGLGWGSGWNAGDRDVVAVLAEDTNSDGFTDLVVAISTDEGTRIDVLTGDGSWNFEAGSAMRLLYPISGMAGFDRGDGFELAVQNSGTGSVRRMMLTDAGWGDGTTELSGYVAPSGAKFLAAANLDNQGMHELVFVHPPEDGEQDIVFFVLDSTPDGIPTQYPLAFDPFAATVADVDDNGADDLVVLEDDVLNVIGYKSEGDRYISQATLGMGSKGPIAVRDWDHDGLGDVAILNDGVTFRRGEVAESGGWNVDAHGWRSYTLDLVGPMLIGDFDEDGTPDVAGITSTGSSHELAAWRFVSDDLGLALQTMGRVGLDQGEAVLDFTRCGQDLYVLMGTPDSRSLYRVRIAANESGYDLVTGLPGQSVSGAHLACGQVTSENDGFALSNTAGEWTSYTNDGSEVASGELGPTGGITLADTDGDGVDEVVACSASDCDIVSGDFDGDGTDEVAWSDGETTVDGWGRTRVYQGSGWLTVQDFDGDGDDDLIRADAETGTLSVFQGVDGGVAPPLHWRTYKDVAGAAWIADPDGQSVFITSDADGKLMHTRTDDG